MNSKLYRYNIIVKHIIIKLFMKVMKHCTHHRQIQSLADQSTPMGSKYTHVKQIMNTFIRRLQMLDLTLHSLFGNSGFAILTPVFEKSTMAIISN
jgi:hypothetical protein